jgi:hypothetical protein
MFVLTNNGLIVLLVELKRLNGDDEVCGDEDERLHVVQYIKALEWVFRYYNLGVPSWRWYVFV